MTEAKKVAKELSEAEKAEKRSYARGYAAGRRHALEKGESAARNAKREEFKRQVFLAVLPQLLDKPWQINGVQWKNKDEFIKGAYGFAEKSADSFLFMLTPEDRAALRAALGEES